MKLFKQEFSRQDFLYLLKTGIETLILAGIMFLFLWVAAILDHLGGL